MTDGTVISIDHPMSLSLNSLKLLIFINMDDVAIMQGKRDHKVGKISAVVFIYINEHSRNYLSKINNNYQTSTFSFVRKIVFISICDWYKYSVTNCRNCAWADRHREQKNICVNFMCSLTGHVPMFEERNGWKTQWDSFCNVPSPIIH